MLEQRYDGTQETLGTAAALTDLRSRLAEHERELHEAWAREAMLREALHRLRETLLGWGQHDTRCEYGYQASCGVEEGLTEVDAALSASDAAPLEAIQDAARAIEEVRARECCCEDAGPGFVCAACHRYGDLLSRLRRLFGEPRPADASSQGGA